MTENEFKKLKTLTEKNCLDYLSTNFNNSPDMKLIPNKFKQSPEFIKKSIKREYFTLFLFDEKFLNEDSYKLAIKNSEGLMIESFPHRLKSPELCLYALEIADHIYQKIDIVDNPDPMTTKKNLEVLINLKNNKSLIKKTIMDLK